MLFFTSGRSVDKKVESGHYINPDSIVFHKQNIFKKSKNYSSV